MNNSKKTSAGWLIGLCLLLIMVAACALFLWSRHNSQVFFAKTFVNGIDVSGLTPEEALPLICASAKETYVRLIEQGTCVLEGTLEDFGYVIEEEALKSLIREALKLQGNDLFCLIPGIFVGNRFTFTIPRNCREELLSSFVRQDRLSRPRTASQNARLKFRKKKKIYTIVPEVYGNEILDDDLRQLVKENLDVFIKQEVTGQTAIINIPDSLYLQPSVTAEDPTLLRLCNGYNQVCGSVIVYRFGSQTIKLAWKDFKDWLIIREHEPPAFDEQQLAAYVSELASTYNTRFMDRRFYTSLGYEITIPGYDNEYGYTIDEEAEKALLLENLYGNQRVEREPVYKLANEYDNPYFLSRDGVDDLAGTYVEISLELQHLWYYKDWAVLLESDIVSGNPAKGAQTKTGAFPLAYKESPSVLVGSNANDGYRTKVQYWMPFYEGQGLHDATWRGSFGGSIYRSNGSHGCVNLPYWAAEMIYLNIEPGTAIIIY